MIKFIHKKHINQSSQNAKIVIYYSISDIVLGIVLMALVAFFIYNYLEFKVFSSQINKCVYGIAKPYRLPLAN